MCDKAQKIVTAFTKVKVKVLLSRVLPDISILCNYLFGINLQTILF